MNEIDRKICDWTEQHILTSGNSSLMCRSDVDSSISKFCGEAMDKLYEIEGELLSFKEENLPQVLIDFIQAYKNSPTCGCLVSANKDYHHKECSELMDKIEETREQLTRYGIKLIEDIGTRFYYYKDNIDTLDIYLHNYGNDNEVEETIEEITGVLFDLNASGDILKVEILDYNKYKYPDLKNPKKSFEWLNTPNLELDGLTPEQAINLGKSREVIGVIVDKKYLGDDKWI